MFFFHPPHSHTTCALDGQIIKYRMGKENTLFFFVLRMGKINQNKNCFCIFEPGAIFKKIIGGSQKLIQVKKTLELTENFYLSSIFFSDS
jgi:hypothetical protein